MAPPGQAAMDRAHRAELARKALVASTAAAETVGGADPPTDQAAKAGQEGCARADRTALPQAALAAAPTAVVVPQNLHQQAGPPQNVYQQTGHPQNVYQQTGHPQNVYQPTGPPQNVYQPGPFMYQAPQFDLAGVLSNIFSQGGRGRGNPFSNRNLRSTSNKSLISVTVS